jgi:DNA invertase Pin-like site-specific DNA recombinase
MRGRLHAEQMAPVLKDNACGRRPLMLELDNPLPLETVTDFSRSKDDLSLHSSAQRSAKFSMLIGYARVSTVDQNTSLQFDAFMKAGISNVYEEKRSAVKRRPVLDDVLSRIGPGDVLVVYKMDRLARSLQHLLSVLALLEARGASFRSLTETIDTHSAAGRLFMQMLGSFSEFERALIRERCAAGQAAARARGQTWGRPRAMGHEAESEVVSLYLSGWFTMQVLSEAFGVTKESVKRAIYRVTQPDSTVLH